MGARGKKGNGKWRFRRQTGKRELENNRWKVFYYYYYSFARLFFRFVKHGKCFSRQKRIVRQPRIYIYEYMYVWHIYRVRILYTSSYKVKAFGPRKGYHLIYNNVLYYFPDAAAGTFDGPRLTRNCTPKGSRSFRRKPFLRFRYFILFLLYYTFGVHRHVHRIYIYTVVTIDKTDNVLIFRLSELFLSLFTDYCTLYVIYYIIVNDVISVGIFLFNQYHV